MVRTWLVGLISLCAFGCIGCAPQVPRGALELSPESLTQRRLQTRRFDTPDEVRLLQASLGVLQDLGFNIDESESRLGIIVASKNRDATDPTMVIGAIAIGALVGQDIQYDTTQRIRASLVTRPVSRGETLVRVTFQRTVWNQAGQITRNESLDGPELYREFFFKLSKSVFLDAHGI
jgi:hypothetical protein